MKKPSVGGAGLQRMLDAVPTRVWLLDAAHRVRWANRQAAALLGKTPEEVMGLSFPEIFGANHALDDIEERESALAGQPATWSGWADYSDGIRRFTERHFVPHEDEAGEIDGYYEFTSDQTELMAARDAADRAERMLRDAIASLPDGLGIEAADGRLAACNPAYEAIYGAESEVILGMPFEERMDIAKHRLVPTEAVRSGADPSTAYHHLVQLRRESLAPFEAKHVDGRDFLVQRAPTGDGGRVVLMTDVSKLRQRERETAEAVRLLEDAVQAIAAGFAIFDPDGGLSLWNRHFTTLAAPGTTRRGMKWPDILAEGARCGWFVAEDGDVEAFVRTLATDLDCSGTEREFDLSDGRRVAVGRSPTRSGGAVIMMRDVTERLRVEAARRESWDMVRSVLEVCPTPITMARLDDGYIEYMNPAARELWRFDPNRSSGGSLLPHWPTPDDRDAFVDAVRRNGRVDGYEQCFMRGDGTDVWLSLWARLAWFRGEAVTVTTSTDLTERRAQEAELARQREIVHQAEKLAALGEVLAGVSHELNNPLSVLVGQAAILLETAPDEKVKRRAERLAEAAGRCARIVRSFLAMARQRPTDVVLVDAGTLVREALSIAGSEILAAEAEVRLDLPVVPVHAAGDTEQLRQVMVNLLTNAAQALTGHPLPRRIEVVVRGDKAAGLVRIRVSDTGPGVPPGIASRIFDPLFTTKAGKGSGIGLALCHRIVTAHGGQIVLESATPVGATFCVELPLGDATYEDEISPAERQSPEGLTVLVLDDDEDVLRTTSELLQLDGHRVIPARAAREALSLLGGMDLDAVISDVRMPDIDGLAFYRLVRARSPKLARRFVFATGDTLSPEVARTIRDIGRPCLEKPFLPDDIRSILRDIAPTRRG